MIHPIEGCEIPVDDVNSIRAARMTALDNLDCPTVKSLHDMKKKMSDTGGDLAKLDPYIGIDLEFHLLDFPLHNFFIHLFLE